jgi:hypothetical protein
VTILTKAQDSLLCLPSALLFVFYFSVLYSLIINFLSSFSSLLFCFSCVLVLYFRILRSSFLVSSLLFHADRRTDMTKLIVAFRKFANMPKENRAKSRICATVHTSNTNPPSTFLILSFFLCLLFNLFSLYLFACFCFFLTVFKSVI